MKLPRRRLFPLAVARVQAAQRAIQAGGQALAPVYLDAICELLLEQEDRIGELERVLDQRRTATNAKPPKS